VSARVGVFRARLARWPLVAAVTIASAASASAHPPDPARLELRELPGGALQVLWREPTAPPGSVALGVVLPDDCKPLAEPTITPHSRATTSRFQVRCAGGGLEGRRIQVSGLSERQTDALLRAHLADGRVIETVLRPSAPAAIIEARAGRWRVAGAYVQLGIEHISTGLDHLLFVLGLVLLLAGRQLAWTITAFTAGHSVTLSLAVLGVVQIPQKPVEVMIALSLLMVACELSGADARVRRRPWLLAFAFGLLHGLGFAGALSEVGLPAHAVPLALSSFNIGIELGQLACVAAVLAVRRAISSLPARSPPALHRVPAYAIGSLSVFWICERLAFMW